MFMHAHVCKLAGSSWASARRWPVTLGIEEQPPGSRGEAMVAELKWVHSMIRQDLQTVRRLADDVQGGMSGGRVAAGIRSLVAGGPLWQLKINCLQYCRFVHSHHHAESVMLFPALRRLNPELGPVIDKLEADHARVSDLLDEVEAASGELAAQEGPATRHRLTTALQVLSDELLAHLAYEEGNVSATLRTMTAWPSW
jgi:Hemerythrin HHE cation binding domain